MVTFGQLDQLSQGDDNTAATVRRSCEVRVSSYTDTVLSVPQRKVDRREVKDDRLSSLWAFGESI